VFLLVLYITKMSKLTLTKSCVRNSLLKTKETCISHINSFNEIISEEEPHDICNLCFDSECKYFNYKQKKCNHCKKVIHDRVIYYYDDLEDVFYCKSCKKHTQLITKQNQMIIEELIVKCMRCNKNYHSICALASFFIKPGEDFMCPKCMCVHLLLHPPPAAHLFSPTHIIDKNKTPIIDYLYDNFLVEYKQAVRVMEVLSNKRERIIFMFYLIDEIPVLIFAICVCYYSESWLENGTTTILDTRDMYISYIDSINLFQPKVLRTNLYQQCLLGIIDYSRIYLNINKCFLWSCPLEPNSDYIFNLHPPSQRFPDQKMLDEWYIKLFKLGMEKNVITKYLSFNDYLKENNITEIDKIPYFKGDAWTLMNRENAFKYINGDNYKAFACVLCPSAPSPIVNDAERDIMFPITRSRCEFWNTCYNNRLQFNSIRHAKHTSLTILYLIDNPGTNFFTYTCDFCFKSIPQLYTLDNISACNECLEFKVTDEKILRLKYAQELDNFNKIIKHTHMCNNSAFCTYCEKNGIKLHARMCTNETCDVKMCLHHKIKFIKNEKIYNQTINS
jgi:hypothetical protein